MTSLTSSPSSVTTRRSTPCVDGCCGPMLTTTSLKARPSTSEPSPRAVASSMRRRASLTASSGSGVSNCSNMRVVLDEVDVVLAQRVADEVVLEQDAAQVGMPEVLDPDHVPSLALMPVRGRPDTGHGVDLGLRARQLHVQLEVRVRLPRVHVVDALDVAHLVHAGDEVERLVADLGVALEASREILEHALVAACHDRVRLLHAHVPQLVAEVGDQAGGDRVHLHRVGADLESHAQLSSAGAGASTATAGTPAAIAGFSATNRCCCILPCSSSSPWKSASGRGGQPGMYTSTGTILSTPLTTL